MKIPHKSKQKENWLYWDFEYKSDSLFSKYVNAIEIFVKSESIALVSERVYRSLWRNVHEYGEIEIPENINRYPFNSYLADIEKKLFLMGHFPLFGWNKTMKIKIPPPLEINILFNGNDHRFHKISEGHIDYDKIPLPLELKYFFKKSDVNNAYYDLMSRVKIQVE
jgi:hypothetical protein